MVVRLIVAILVWICITSLAHFYIFQRIVDPLLEPQQQSAGLSVVASLWAMTLFGFPVARAIPRRLRGLLEMFMFTWMGVAYLLLLVCIATIPFSVWLRIFGHSQAQLAVFVCGVTSVLAWRGVAKILRHEKLRYQVIPVQKKLPSELEKLSAVVLSDVHVAGIVGARRMRRLVQSVNALKPDFIFVTGDLVDGSVRQLRNDVLPLRDLKAAFGIYYVTGNHEFYSNPKQWREFCANELGWTVLSNSSCQVAVHGHTVNIIGIEDRSWLRQANGRSRVDTRLELAVNTLQGAEVGETLNILLAHQPKDAPLVEKFPWIDVQISGHTHGGQFWPLHFFVYRDQKYNTGLYTIKNTHTRLYVSEGTGFWGPPMRLGTNCEISVLRFVGGRET